MKRIPPWKRTKIPWTCHVCKHKNVSFNWIPGMGQCRNCGARVDFRYPLEVE
jgi:transcription elongation factor Elf1